MMLSEEDFKHIIKHTVLVAIDLIAKNNQGEILVGLRKNSPAKGFWFVPGGRVFKNETLREALIRIAHNEIGVEVKDKETKLLGVFEHIYDDNFYGDAAYNTHYIILACQFTVTDIEINTSVPQHEALKFMTVAELLASKDVHEYTKNYFLELPDNQFLRKPTGF
jgi:colanic acid biosynthesis protein WcaH